MSHKTIASIEMTLDRQSINNAIRQIRHIQEQITEAMNDLIRRLAEEGVKEAKAQVVAMDAVDTGELEGSIYGYFDPESRIGYVIAGAPYAFYVEYGTGPVGEANPHPEAAQAGWQYAIGEHIKQGPGGLGWWYDKSSNGVTGGEGNYRWTHGQPARPFMYNTMVWLEEAAEKFGRTLLS